MSESVKETHEFQTEVAQLLRLMIHSLYSNKEIFLRELISNASDACDKLRFEALSDDSLFGGDSELVIHLAFDKDARTVTVRDNGIGMNREEVVENIGTIARSGTRQFLDKLTGDQAADAQLIGQFGVGFYSSFIVAESVVLYSRRAGDPVEAGVRWESHGGDGYTLENVAREHHGTEVVLALREDADEFLDAWRLRGIVKKYSDHITFPVRMQSTEKDGEDEATDAGEETVNAASALWMRAKKDISDEEYQTFYKHLSHDFEDPLTWTHNRVEGKYEYTTLLYLPARAPFDLWDRDHIHGIKLYVQRVFIMDDSEQLIPRYLRFVRGLVDSSDLPLNVSREILQSNKVIDSIRSGSVKKILALLQDLADKEPEKYASFWTEFGRVLKEGPGEDHANREAIAKLLRFASTHSDSEEQTVSLDQYIERMGEGQAHIYYITADAFNAAKNSPHLESLRAEGTEVLLMYDRVDDWMMSFLQEYEGKKLVSVAKGEWPDTADDDVDTSAPEDGSDKELTKRIGDALGERVDEVRVSKRLTTSPACLVFKEHEMALHMQALLKQAGHDVPSSKPTLEINPAHPLLVRMDGETDDTRFGEWASILLDQAILAEGGQLEDPAGFVKRLNDVMLAMGED
ncbi:MAG: molecular chaperone HtpG [Gammaproteobacteria bacterium]|nr:molecular chaperone HtpG [Gammaproteobacteria bacterium]